MNTYNYSIVLPYRDKYELFLKAIDSIPDRDDIQIIVVDNAIEPLTKDQIPAKDYAHVEYFNSSTTKGAGCARNVGLQHVKGKYIIFLDADDYYYLVELEMKEGEQPVMEKEFTNEMVAQSVRHEIYLQTKNIRELMLARAMATTVIAQEDSEQFVSDETDEYSEDEILKDWFAEG